MGVVPLVTKGTGLYRRVLTGQIVSHGKRKISSFRRGEAVYGCRRALKTVRVQVTGEFKTRPLLELKTEELKISQELWWLKRKL